MPSYPSGEPAVAAGNDAYFCDTCRLGCSGPVAWSQHLHSAKHIKKTQIQEQRGLVRGEDPDGVTAPVMDGGDYFCHLCVVFCSGPEPWQQHIESAKHLRRVTMAGSAGYGRAASSPPPPAEAAPTRQYARVPSPPPPAAPVAPAPRAFWAPTSAAGLPTAPVAAGGAVYFCQLCQLSCSGPAPFRQHLDSGRHLKMAAQRTTAAAAAAPPAVVSRSASASQQLQQQPSAVAGSFFCDVCQLFCTGPAPYRQHVESAKHLKRAAAHNRLTSGGAGSTAAALDPGTGSWPTEAQTAAPPPAAQTSVRAEITSAAGPGTTSAAGPGTTSAAGPGTTSAAGPGTTSATGPGTTNAAGPGTSGVDGPGTTSVARVAEVPRTDAELSLQQSDCSSSAPEPALPAGSLSVDSSTAEAGRLDSVDSPAAARRGPLQQQLPSAAAAAVVYSRRRLQYSPEQLSVACAAIRRGSSAWDEVGEREAISRDAAVRVSRLLKTLPDDGVVAFLADTPVLYAHEPVSLKRC